MTNPEDNDLVEAMRAATEATWFTAEPHDGGVLMRSSDDPLDYVWQTIGQARDIIAKLEDAIRQQEANNAGR